MTARPCFYKHAAPIGALTPTPGREICGREIRTGKAQLRSLLLAAGLLWSLGGSAAPPPAGVAPILVPAGGFAIDGDLLANTPITNVGDWLPATNFPGTGGSVLDAAGVPLNPITTFHFVDPYGGNDTVFSGGIKWTDDPNTWKWTIGKAPAKTDINNVLLHIGFDTNAHIWIVIAGDRLSTSGDSYIDFEFLQNTLVENTNGTFTSAGPEGGRTANDLLLSLAFGGGGGVAEFFAWQWQTNASSGGFAYVDVTANLPVGRVFAALNSNTIAVPFGAFGQTNYPQSAFAEAAVDLTALVGNFNPCQSLGFKTIMVKTKASQSGSATIEDFIDPIQYPIKIGPSANPGPDQTRCTQGPATAFPLQGTATAGLYPIASTTWSVVSGAATIDAPASLVTTAHVSSATATLRLTVVQTNGCFESNDVVLTVAPLPTCSITGPSLVCPRSSTSFSGPAGMAAYSWSITGNGALTGPTNAQNVTVAAGPACRTNFTLLLNVTSNGCSSACATNVMVNDTTRPTLVCPSNLLLECPANTSTNVTGVAIAQDNCGSVTVSYSDAVSNTCGGAYVIWRTWTATDPCGNSTNCVQTITVRDTTPPVLTCASNRNVECGTAWTFDTPSASDTCSGTNVTITVVSTVTNRLVGQTFRATRTWQALDACSNSAFCQQTITVVDTTPPQIFCSSNIIVECAGPPGNQVFFTTTALDACDTNVTVVCTPPSGSYFFRGTNAVLCVATDASGNSNHCVFQVIVRDTTPPQIACQSNINAAESPRGSGGAVVTFPAATAADVCDTNLLVFSSPPSGSLFPVGTNVVTSTAVDSSGNSNSCTFLVRVIPYLLQVANTNDSGPGSLRQALLDANASPDVNQIVFNLPGAGPFTVHLLSALPPIISPVIIDGWSQSGSNRPPVIELDGSTASNAIDGLVISAGNTTVRGLVLDGFATALRLVTNGNNLIEGNFIGTDLTGTNTDGNTGDGIYINSPRNVIGGSAAGAGNVISGNGRNGIEFDTISASNNVVQGNLIGVGADGSSPLGNGQNGVLFTNQPARNLVGGTTNGAGNVIAFNGHNGITLASSAGGRNALLANSIYSNVGLGIDLGDDGVTLNDATDTDTGPNGFQNFPVLLDVESINGTTTISGGLSSLANLTYRVEFFLNDNADPSGYGEGQIYLGFTLVTLDGSGTNTFSLSLPLSATFTQFITATATDPEGDASEFSRAMAVGTPPIIVAQPISTNAPVGSTATFCATVLGTPPLFYQWRLNGFNIAGATNPCYTIPSAQIPKGGSYSVIVANSLGALSSQLATLTLPLTNLPGADFFTNRVTLTGTNGVISGQNTNATVEPGEPEHAGKPGGKSVWYTWQAPVTGVATFTTVGSTFDTLLAIYTGSALTNLVLIDSDENHGGFYTSRAFFNVLQGTQYQIAIDGFGGASGEYILGWQVEATEDLLPVFTTQPTNQTIAPGATVTFAAVAVPVCEDDEPDCTNPHHYPGNDVPTLAYQWYFFGSPIPGATTNSLTITNVQGTAVGTYTLHVSALGHTVISDDVSLQINLTASQVENVQAADKFLDAANSPNPLILGVSTGAAAPASLSSLSVYRPLDSSIVRGYTGTQIFNTTGSGTGPGEVVCGVIGGASDWIAFVPEQSGILFLNTDGSSYNTVMAVFIRSPTNAAVLIQLACDNNSGSNGLASALSLPVSGGQTNYIIVDGVNGATGILQLNYALVTQVALKSIGLTTQSVEHIQVIGQGSMHFTIQASTDLLNWKSLLTTNVSTNVFDFFDTNAATLPRRYYRALMLP